MTGPMRVQAGQVPNRRLALSARFAMAWQMLTRRDFQGVLPDGVIPPRGIARRGAALVTPEMSLRHSAVWAALRLRADLISTFPLDVYRKGTGALKGIDIEVPKPNILVEPGGSQWDYLSWTWASQHTYDGSGNSIGLITEWDGNGLPGRIDLVPSSVVTVIMRKGSDTPIYKIDGKEYTGGAWTKPGDPGKVWHERQYPVPGTPIGLSPIAAAAWTVGEYLSIQDFVLDWFGGGAVPKARMRNKSRVLKEPEIKQAKQWYRDVMANGDLLVYGNDWEYDMIQAENAGMGWLDSRAATIPDISRYIGVPADLIDGALAGQSITYANQGQRNVQFLIINLGPAVIKRENNYSKLTARPRYVKMTTGGLLRMDPETAEKIINMRLLNKSIVNSEARAFNNLEPLTPAQEDEAERLYPIKVAPQPTKPGEAQGMDLSSLDGPNPPPSNAAWYLDPAAPASPAPIGARPW